MNDKTYSEIHAEWTKLHTLFRQIAAVKDAAKNLEEMRNKIKDVPNLQSIRIEVFTLNGHCHNYMLSRQDFLFARFAADLEGIITGNKKRADEKFASL